MRFNLAQADLVSVQQLDIDSYLIDEIDMRLLYGRDLGLEWTGVDTEQNFEFVSDTRVQNRILLKLDILSMVESGLNDVETTLVEVQQIIGALPDVN